MNQNCEIDFKTSVFSNKLVFKNLFEKLTGSVESKKFYGTSAHSSQTISWHYTVELAADRPKINLIVDDAASVNKSKLHGELRTSYNISGYPDLAASGIIKAGTSIGGYVHRIFINTSSANGTGTLSLIFSIHELVQEDVPLPQTVAPLPDSQLLDHFADLLESEKFADVTIIVGEKKFLSHKAILAARSSVFAAMFEHELEESEENRVTIMDIRPQVFQEMLRFIYTGIVKELVQLAHELLVAADKYDLSKLRLLCEEHLASTMSVETATRTLCLADLHHAEHLKQQAVQFISRNIKAIQAADWQAIISTNPALAAQMFVEMARLN